MKKSIAALIFIAVSAVVVLFSGNFDFIWEFLKISPHIVGILAGLTLILCLRFNKSRVSFMLAFLLFWFFKNIIPGVSAIPENEFLVFTAFSVLYLANASERGVFTVHGLKKALIIIFQLGLFYYFTVYNTSMYLESENTVIRRVYLLLNLPYAFFPLILLLIAAAGNIVRDRSYDISFTVGATIGLTALSAQGMAITELNMVAALVLMFIGTLSAIYTLSYIDELTGLPGRRSYNEYTAALGSTYTIAMGDIDHFKKFNDRYGHDTGDEVLKLVARILSTVGGGGKAFRFGGEEFVIVFNGKLKEKTAGYLDGVRTKIAKTPFTVRNRKSRKKYQKTGMKVKPPASKNIRITMSFGASDSRGGKNPARVMKEADVALYKSKKRGRNKVTV